MLWRGWVREKRGGTVGRGLVAMREERAALSSKAASRRLLVIVADGMLLSLLSSLYT